jgi:hypothetical protein
LADKSTRLILEALGRAAAAPAGLPLHAGKSEPGLFPPTTLAKAAADRCKDAGWLQVVRSETKGKLVREICALTDEGRRHLVRSANPRQVLEDFVRILEARQSEVTELADNARAMRQSLAGMQAAIEQLLPRLSDNPAHVANGSTQPGTSLNGSTAASRGAHPTLPAGADALTAEIKAKLTEWHAAAGGGQDCPLPELYRKLEPGTQLSIGHFHDCLRRLHEQNQIYLHPWTGPLYALPEPAYALLVGHEIAYYASVR